MGTLGRVLIILHGAASIAVLAWALGVSTQKLKWQSVNKDDPGRFDRQKDKPDEYSRAADRALNRWSSNYATVQQLEGERFPRRAFFEGQKFLVVNGHLGKDPVPNPVQQLQNAPNGFLDIRQPVGRPPVEVRPGVAARSISQYQKDMAKMVQDIRASEVQNEKAIADRDAFNKEIAGETEPMRKKGLRQFINEQQTIEERANVEATYVTGFATNREAEFGLLKKRRDAMTARMEELKDKKTMEELKDKKATGTGGQ